MKINDIELERSWQILLTNLENVLGKKPADLNAILFLIGVQELGKIKNPFTKEEKQDLMHIATCKLLSKLGYYQLVGQDQEGWPIWEPMTQLPPLKLGEQEKLIKMQALDYFEDII